MRLNRKRRILLGVTLTLLALVAYAFRWKWERRPIRREFATQRAGESRRIWRVMRTAWTFQPGPVGTRWTVNDLFGNDDRLYYACDCEAGCLDPDTGKTLWRFPFLSHSLAQAGPSNSDRTWRLVRDKSLLYACECRSGSSASFEPFRVCALDARTGKLAWEAHFSTPPYGPPCPAGLLLLLPNEDGTIKALRRTDGALIWQKRLTANVFPRNNNEGLTLHLGAAEGIGMLQVNGGHLLAFRVGDGSILWSFPASLRKARAAETGSGDDFRLEQGILYGMLNDKNPVAIEMRTGRRLWTRHASTGGTHWDLVPGTPVRVLSQFGDVFVGLNGRDGKTAWFGSFEGSRSPLTDNTQVAEDTPSLSATAGVGSTGGIAPTRRDTILPVRHSVYLKATSDPLIGYAQRIVRSTGEIYTLIAVDPISGHEQWRWQPPRDVNFDKIVVGRHRLYLTDDTQILAAEDGFEEPLPDNPRGRSLLAQRTLSLQYKWPPLMENPLLVWMRQWAATTRGQRDLQQDPPSNNATELLLMSLGRDSVPPLLDFVRHCVKEQEAQPKPTTFIIINSSMGREVPEGLSNVLSLLFDLDDPTVAPALAEQLERSTHEGTRHALAETLVRMGDMRTLRTLYRYAQRASLQKGTREDALYFVCRNSVPPGQSAGRVGLPSDAPTQDEVTAWLLSCVTSPQTPNWLHCFAKFELLNARGERARRAGQATFHFEKQARLLSLPTALKTAHKYQETEVLNSAHLDFPTEIVPSGIARDASGRWWAAFFCDYLGSNSHLWFAQSTDARRFKQWTRPAFGLNLAKLCTRGGSPDFLAGVKLTCHNGRLRVAWKEVLPERNTNSTGRTENDATDTANTDGANKEKSKERRLQHVTKIAIADLTRDSDGDGIPDLVEKELGLDPLRADTNGNGLPDNKDKNPLYMPHVLNEQEQIYQAVLEALCQLGRSLPLRPKGMAYEMDTPMPFGRSASPLLLPAPPGSRGVEIRGHSGMVFCTPTLTKARLHALSQEETPNNQAQGFTFHFRQPHINLDGGWNGFNNPDAAAPDKPADPLAPSPSAPIEPADKPLTFQDYFPIVFSKDGKRARVGYSVSGTRQGNEICGFDIELRKLEGHWLPVECRRVYSGGHHYFYTPVLPIRNRQDKNAL